MLKQAQDRAQKCRPQGHASFGFRDLKGKGATDMWLGRRADRAHPAAVRPQDKTTTEKYIKARWLETARRNLGKSVADRFQYPVNQRRYTWEEFAATDAKILEAPASK
jgi:hypothetical protein